VSYFILTSKLSKVNAFCTDARPCLFAGQATADGANIVENMFVFDQADGNTGYGKASELRVVPEKAPVRSMIADQVMSIAGIAAKFIESLKNTAGSDLQCLNLLSQATQIHALNQVIMDLDQHILIARTPAVKTEPYTKSKLSKGGLRNVYSLLPGLRMFVLASCSRVATSGDVIPATKVAEDRMREIGFIFDDPLERVGKFMVDNQGTATKINQEVHAAKVITYDVDSFESVLTPVQVFTAYRVLTRLSPRMCLFMTLAINNCRCIVRDGKAKIVTLAPFCWTSGQFLTLYGNTFIHWLMRHDLSKDLKKTVFDMKANVCNFKLGDVVEPVDPCLLQGDDGLVAFSGDFVSATNKNAKLFKDCGVMISFEPELVPKFCGVYPYALGDSETAKRYAREQNLSILLRMMTRESTYEVKSGSKNMVVELVKAIHDGDVPVNYLADEDAERAANLEVVLVE
jgi:hypothetical protein